MSRKTPAPGHSDGLRRPPDGPEPRRGFCGTSSIAEADLVLTNGGFGNLLVVHSFK